MRYIFPGPFVAFCLFSWLLSPFFSSSLRTVTFRIPLGSSQIFYCDSVSSSFASFFSCRRLGALVRPFSAEARPSFPPFPTSLRVLSAPNRPFTFPNFHRAIIRKKLALKDWMSPSLSSPAGGGEHGLSRFTYSCPHFLHRPAPLEVQCLLP